jgi:hypothetical protein
MPPSPWEELTGASLPLRAATTPAKRRAFALTPARAAVALTVAAAVIGGIAAAAVAARGGGGGARGAASTGPEQVALAYLAPSAFAVSWVVPVGASYANATAAAAKYSWRPRVIVNSGLPPVNARVRWGAAPGALTSSAPAGVTSYAYTNGVDWRNVRSNATSPLLFTANITGNAPGAAFFYAVGDDANGFTAPARAVMLPAAGTPGVSLAVIGDLGVGENSSLTLARLLESHAERPFAAVLHLGGEPARERARAAPARATDRPPALAPSRNRS